MPVVWFLQEDAHVTVRHNIKFYMRALNAFSTFDRVLLLSSVHCEVQRGVRCFGRVRQG